MKLGQTPHFSLLNVHNIPRNFLRMVITTASCGRGYPLLPPLVGVVTCYNSLISYCYYLLWAWLPSNTASCGRGFLLILPLVGVVTCYYFRLWACLPATTASCGRVYLLLLPLVGVVTCYNSHLWAWLPANTH